MVIEGNMLKSGKISLLVMVIVLMAIGNAMAAKPLTLTYAGGTGSGASESTYIENVWDYTYQYHVLVLTGDLPQGNLFSMIQAEERDNMSGIGYAKLNLYGSTYSIELGDNITNFSDITLNNMAYQGASVTLRPSNNVSFTVIGGAKGNGLWGADVRRDTRPQEKFSGVRTVYSTDLGLDLNTTYIAATGGQDVFSYGGDYSLDRLRIGAEYGTASDGKAFRGEVKYQGNWFYLGTIYRDVEPTYVVPFDYLSYKGKKGTYTSFNARPLNGMSVSVQNDSYKDLISSDSEDMINETRGDITYNMQSGTNLGFSGWRNDRRAYDRGGITEGEMKYITQQFYLFTKNSFYYRNQPTWFESLTSSEESYAENKNVTGINIALLDSLHLNYEIENATRIFRSTDITINPSAFTARVDMFESQIFNGPFSIGFSVNYRKDVPDRGSTLESTSVYSDATLKYSPNQDLSCYVTGKIFNVDSPDTDRTSREQRDLSFGLNYTFSTNIYLW